MRMDMLAVLTKMEGTYGTDAGPTAAADATLWRDVTIVPAEGDQVERSRMRTYHGAKAAAVVAQRARLSGTIDLAGAGAAGTVPAFGPLLRGAGLAQTVVAGTSVRYTPVSRGHESVTHYVNIDGTLHRIFGARADFGIDIQARQLPSINLAYTGLNLAGAAAGVPTLTTSAWKEPDPVGFATTPTALIHGQAVALQSYSYRHAQQVSLNERVGRRRVEVGDRDPRATVVFEAPDGMSVDWWAKMGNATGAISLVHGTAAGSIVEVAHPATQVMNPTYVNLDGIAGIQMELRILPVTGDDELALTIR